MILNITKSAGQDVSLHLHVYITTTNVVFINIFININENSTKLSRIFVYINFTMIET
jgi:hypothetical protein